MFQRLGALYTLGFICEDIEPEIMNPEQMNMIFGALLENVLPDQVQLT